jgi:MscS family membrane protein
MHNPIARGFAAVSYAIYSVIHLLALLAAAAIPAAAQSGSGAARNDSTRVDASVEVSPGSPRAALQEFLSLARVGNYAAAARYLDTSDSASLDVPRLARQLKAVLDRHLWIDLDRISGAISGDTADGLPPAIEQIGSVRAADGTQVAIRLTRMLMPNADPPWRFARSTVDRVPALYASLDDRWVLEHLPEVLLRPGPFDILRWQWLALPLLLGVAAVLGALGSKLARGVFWRIARRTSTEWDDTVLTRLSGPLTLALTLAFAAALLPFLGLYAPARAASYRVIRVGIFVAFFWSLWRSVDVARLLLSRTRWAQTSASSRALLPLGSRISKVVIVAIAAVAVLSVLGFPVASLIAGLGIGGLALALAAQKTVENLFGAFSIGVDQPFREGDFVKIEDFVGTVEAVGLRSSRFRTLDRTVITIPNGKLADMRLESFTARDRLRLATVIGLVYETTAAQMREVLAGFEQTLRAHPKIWPDAVVVRFREFAASSLDIEVMAWFQTSEWSEFQLIRQEILLQFMEIVERAGTSVAFPTQTIHLGAESVAALAQRADGMPSTRDGAPPAHGSKEGDATASTSQR